MGLKEEEFVRFYECMEQTMVELKIDKKEIEDVRRSYGGYKEDIVTG